MFWGDRYGKLEDPFGHHWSVATHVRDVIAQTRSLARGLSPLVLEAEGLMAALAELATNTEKLFRVK